MSVGRNDPCPCGSGKKVKKCHEYILSRPVEALFIGFDGYQEPLTRTEHGAFEDTGCPHGTCTRETDYGEMCAATCGV